MYKHTYTSISERYLLNEEMQEYITNSIEKLMKKIELSLLYNAYPNIDEEENIQNNYNSFEELGNLLSKDLIKERIKYLRKEVKLEDIFCLNEIKSKKILVSLYEYYLREEMVEYVGFLEIDKKERKEKIKEDFKTFLSTTNNNYIEEFDKEIIKILHNSELIKKIYLNRPTYFLLYRIRNNMLKDIDTTECSENYIKNNVKKIKKFYKDLYINEYNEKFFCKIKRFKEMKNNIFQHIEEEFLDCIKNGKVVNIGNELAKKFKNSIQKDKDYNQLKSKYIELIKIDDGFTIMKRKFEELQEEYNKIATKYLEDKTKINQTWLKDDLNTFLLYCVAQYIVDSYKDDIQDIDCNKIKKIESETIEYIKTKIVKKEKYDVYIKIENVEIEQNRINISNLTFINGKELKEHIEEYLEHKCNKFENDFFRFDRIQEKDVYVIVKGIEAYKNDNKFITELVMKEIDDIINVIYFYTARDKSKKYKLSDRILIIESATGNELVTYSTSEGIFNIPLTSNNWLNNIFNDKDKIKPIIESINEYNNIRSESIINNGMLIKANKKLLNNDSLYNLARTMSILIAGTNIFKYEVQYLNLRFWLIEDYIEFLNDELPDDEFIQERFLNFYRRAINIIFSYSDIKNDNLIKALQNWILKIFPNDYIYEEDKPNNE